MRNDMGMREPMPIKRMITVTFNNGSVYVAKDVRDWGVEDDSLYFYEEANPNKIINILAHSMKMYTVETLY
jgi:hypothetical protein